MFQQIAPGAGDKQIQNFFNYDFLYGFTIGKSTMKGSRIQEIHVFIMYQK